MNVAVIIPAAGASSRYAAAGGLRHKLDEDLGGKPVLQRTVETFTKYDDDFTLGPIIVAGPHDDDAFAEFRDRHGDRLTLLGATFVRGGKTHRWETVAAALASLASFSGLIAIHDGARPCVTFPLLTRVFRAAARSGAAVPGVRVSDTLKRVRFEDAPAEDADRAAAILGLEPRSAPRAAIEATVPRDALYAVQTPQVFDSALLRAAYARVVGNETDDAQVVESLAAAGERPTLSTGKPWTGTITLVEGEARNIKITTPEDLALARNIMGFREPEGRATHKKF